MKPRGYFLLNPVTMSYFLALLLLSKVMEDLGPSKMQVLPLAGC
jgi:hypothetical protein